MGKLGDTYKELMREKASLVEDPAPDPNRDEEEARRYSISKNLGDHYRDRQDRLEAAAKKNTKSDAKLRTSPGIIGVRG